MKPILFAENTTTFTSNGIGRLSDALDCTVTEERNGQYELEMTYPMSGQHYGDIAIRKIVVVKPSANATLQAFRIYKMGKPINGKVTIYAQHITYDLSKNVCMPQTVTASGTACNTALQGLKNTAIESCPFSFWTDVTTVASYKQTVPGSIRSRLGGVEGSILDQFGGEYEWDNLTVKLHHHRGSDRDITLRYGKNITDIEQEENIAETVTGVVPYWIDYEGTTTVMLPERVIYSSHASEYSSKLTVPLDLSSQWENPPTESALRAAATVYMNKSGMGIPKVSVKVSFINLADTEEYKDILPLENVNLCDTIKVQFVDLGIDTTAEIVETVYDVLAEKYKSVQVGSLRSTLASTINDMEKGMATEIDDQGRRVFAEANSKTQDLVNNATAWLTSSNGYVIAVKNQDGSWKELIFADHNDPTQWHNLLRINENGIGFSSDGGATYTQAWTLDGRLVIGGTNVPSITVYDNADNILFQAGIFDVNNSIRSWIIWNAQNSTLDENGTLTARDAHLSGVFTNTNVTTKTVSGHEWVYTREFELSEGVITGSFESTRDGNTYRESESTISVSDDNVFSIGTNNTIELKTSKDNDAIIKLSHSSVQGGDTNILLECSHNVSVDAENANIGGSDTSMRTILLEASSEITIKAPNIYIDGTVHYIT